MDVWKVMRERHSVRKFLDRPIEQTKTDILNSAIDEINAKGSMHFQMFIDEPEAFKAGKEHYGSFKNCKNYFALVAPKGMDEEVGYYGEELVLRAQEINLNTCWVALTYEKGKVRVKVDEGEKLYLVIALGYGEDQGRQHKSKPVENLAKSIGEKASWFDAGMDAVMLAPTALNQQRFYFEQHGNKVLARNKLAALSKVDLGIAKYHFELGAGKENFEWE